VIEEIAEVSQIYASNEAARVRGPLRKAAPIYRQLIATKKDYYRQTARRYALTPELVAMVNGPQGADADRYLDEMLREVPELYRITVLDSDGEVAAERVHSAPVGVGERYRAHPVTAPIGDDGARLQLVFAADLDVRRDLEALGEQLDEFKHVDRMRSSLPEGYRSSFLVVVGGVVLVVTLTGILLARRLTRRIEVLVTGTREVAAGNLEARVDLSGRDELGELASAFNSMVEELERKSEQISYLQRVGAWQDVARKLAHEIKNPLTPIQLAMQQVVSSYDGDDARFRKLLSDADEIVSEEIASLRRLVDAFRTLGQLPKVEAEPLDLGSVIEDMTKDPSLLDHLELDSPNGPVMIRGDRLLLRRVLTNLVENGMQAGQGRGREGKVVVKWWSESYRNRAFVTVDDEGPGIGEEDRQKIFEPYVTTKELGTGLGLTISKKIALEHGGTLEVAADKAPTGGARFALSLPLAPADDKRAARGA
jgi:nitrogen fixation/metabolism regulation signal transduction histidine kinase